MKYLIDVLSVSPLAVRFSFYRAEDAEGPTFVPRLIRPLGYFVRATIRGLSGEVLYRTTEPKMEAKLNPTNDESYLALDAGYSYGALLEDDVTLPEGDYVLAVQYSNREYRGSAARPIGELRHETALDVRVDRQDERVS